MVLRIEDTDRERSTPENIEQILDALRNIRNNLQNTKPSFSIRRKLSSMKPAAERVGPLGCAITGTQWGCSRMTL